MQKILVKFLAAVLAVFTTFGIAQSAYATCGAQPWGDTLDYCKRAARDHGIQDNAHDWCYNKLNEIDYFTILGWYIDTEGLSSLENSLRSGGYKTSADVINSTWYFVVNCGEEL